MFLASPGSRNIFEDEIKVVRFRRLLEANVDGPERGTNPSEASRAQRLLQIYDSDGRLRTLAVDDIVDVR